MDISKELAMDLLAHLDCDETPCEDCTLNEQCKMNGASCTENLNISREKLRAALAAVERNGNVSRETRPKLGPPDLGLPEPDKASKYITITVAEYHCLTKAAAWLEMITHVKDYEHTVVINAVKASIEAMYEQAGAAE